jgi:hypothetical protein
LIWRSIRATGAAAFTSPWPTRILLGPMSGVRDQRIYRSWRTIRPPVDDRCTSASQKPTDIGIASSWLHHADVARSPVDGPRDLHRAAAWIGPPDTGATPMGEAEDAVFRVVDPTPGRIRPLPPFNSGHSAGHQMGSATPESVDLNTLPGEPFVYIPRSFECDDSVAIRNLLEKHSFGVLITTTA